MKNQRDPDHPIIESPHLYDIIDFHYHHDGEDYKESYIDLVLKKDDLLRRLRFLEPKDLKIEKGFPCPTRGLCILDVSHHQLERINVHVSDFEASHGSVTFWAYKVIDLDKPEKI
ncbi:MAG: hypothetical protein PVJ20_06595 [Desulfobacterales bacterium]|jgi:hypothetical protein